MKISDILSLDPENELLSSDSVNLSTNIDFFDHQINQFSKDKSDDKLGGFIYISNNRRTEIRMTAGATRSRVLPFLSKEQKRIAVLITEEPFQELHGTVPQIIVTNSWETYKKIANFQRNLFKKPVISITGSVGKSTTRLLCCALFEAHKKSVLTNDKYGSNVRTIIPRMLTQLAKQDVALLEVSINGLTNFDGGPISPLIQSDISVITQVGGSHLGDFKNCADPTMELAKRKANIFKGMKQNGFAILNLDMEPRILTYLQKEATRSNLKIKHFSLKNEAVDAYILKKQYFKDYTVITVSVDKEVTTLKLNMPTDGVLSDLLAALLVFKNSGNDITDLYDVLENFKSLDDELEIFEVQNNNLLYTVVDDTHGSTILSAINTISFFSQRGQFYTGKKVLVMETGEDLGDHANKLNTQLLPHIINSTIDVFIGYGDENIRELVHSLQNQNFNAYWVPDIPALFELFEAQPSDSLIFIKSRDGRKEKYKSNLWTFPKLVKKKYPKKYAGRNNVQVPETDLWLSDLKEISKQKKIYISGTTYFSQRLARVLMTNNIDVAGFVLINKNNRQQALPVVSYNDVDAKNAYIIVTVRGNKKIERILSEIKISEENYCFSDGREMWYSCKVDGTYIGKWSTGDNAFPNCLGAKSKHNCIKDIGNFTTINGSSKMNVDHAQTISVNNKFLSCLAGDRTGKKYIISPPGISIGADVWIGANTYINASKVSRIGNGAIIAAGAIVNEDVPDFAVVAGVPGKIVKYRYTEDQIEILNRVQWWNWDNHTIENNKHLILNPDLFFEEFKQ